MTCLQSLYSALAHSSPGAVTLAAADHIHPDVQWHVAHPVNDLLGVDQVVDEFLQPLARAIPDIERRPFINLQESCDENGWLAGTGYLTGTFASALFGIPATGKTLHLRYTEMARIVDKRIAEYYLIPDFIDAMDQAGVYPLRPSLGIPGLVMPPATLDGLCPPGADNSQGERSLQLVMDMLDCLRRYDGESLQSMDLENYWHPDFLWYGPGGIGTTRGIVGFRDHHQGPFLRAFPDRDVDHHLHTIACGNYVATGGWPHMHASHRGGGWLGLPPSNRLLGMRVMDLWRCEGDKLRENWVAIDIPEMLLQMGLDIFAPLLDGQMTGVKHE